MTVDIAVLCEGGKTVVVASDRMVVNEFGTISLRSESDCIKFDIIGSNALMLFSGSIVDEQAVLRVAGDLKDCLPSDLANKIRSACQSHHNDTMESILKKVGLSLKALGEEAIKQVQQSSLVATALKTTVGHFLIAATDSARSYIYTVNDGAAATYDDPGFAAIGSGGLIAHSSLAVRGANKQMSIEEAAYVAFEAKRQAEANYGVGTKTDMGIVGAGLPAALFPEDTVNGFQRIYQSRRTLSKADRKAIRRLMNA